jgi:hypothetical protein
VLLYFTDPNWKSRWEGVDIDLASPHAGPQIVRAYLSRQHYDDVENSCPMVALPSDVARSDPTVKAAFETVFKAMVALLGHNVRNTTQPPEDTAMAIAGLCIGGMVVARSLNDSRFGDRLRDAAARAALMLGGWEPDAYGASSTIPHGKSPVALKTKRIRNSKRTAARAKH